MKIKVKSMFFASMISLIVCIGCIAQIGKGDCLLISLLAGAGWFNVFAILFAIALGVLE